jgi:hypothetical protein
VTAALKLPGVASCSAIALPKFPDRRGSLTYIEGPQEIGFRIARVYWIYDVPGGAVREGHAYRDLDEFIIALSGSFSLRVEDGTASRTFLLNRADHGVHLPAGLWRQIYDLSTNAVCLVLASREFDEASYIRDYAAFLRFRGAAGC